MWNGRASRRFAVEVGDRVAVAAQFDDLVLAEFDGLTGELDERRHVAAEEHLALADADDQRGVAPRGDDDVGLLGVEQHERERTLQPAADRPHGVGAALRSAEHGAAPTRCATTSVSVSLAISTPRGSSSSRSSAKFSMIPLWTTAIRPSASVCGWALRSLGRRGWPSGCGPCRWCRPRSPAPPASALSRLASRPAPRRRCGRRRDHRDARRVVAAVLHAAQAHDDLAGRARSDVADDAAHSDQGSAAPPAKRRADRRCRWPAYLRKRPTGPSLRAAS